MNYRESARQERALVLPSRRRWSVGIAVAVFAGTNVVLLLGSMLIGASLGIWGTVVAIAVAVMADALLSWYGRRRVVLRRSGDDLVVQRLAGSSVIGEERIRVHDDAVTFEIAKRTRNGAVRYGVVMKATRGSIDLDDADFATMNEPLARQARLEQLLRDD